MKFWRVKLSLFINYFVFAMLLNSVGTVILMVQNNFGVSEGSASVLEAFKDLPIAITSFLVGTFIVRIGYKRAMLIGLALMTVVSLVMPSVPQFWMTKLLFLTVGVSFALIKVSVYATIGLISKDEKEHVTFMNFIESFFMVGVLLGYFVFTAFINDDDPLSTSWMNVYYLMAGLAACAFILMWSTPMDESAVHKTESPDLTEEIGEMFRLIVKPLILVFIVSIFLYVLIEQSIMSWLPTFNKEILNLPTTLSIQMTSILAGATALGRFLAGFVLKKVHWHIVVSISLVMAGVLVLVCMPLAQGAMDKDVTGWMDAPLAAFIFPMIGLCLAPVYPAVNSTMLSALPVSKHGPMSGLIVVFSALGGTTGSMITGNIFEHYGGQSAFYFSLVPITLILIALFLFRRAVEKEHPETEVSS